MSDIKLTITLEELTALIDAAIDKRLSKQAEQEEFLSLDEASKFLSLCKATIYYHVGKKQIPFSKKGKRLMFSKKDLSSWVLTGKCVDLKPLDKSDEFLTVDQASDFLHLEKNTLYAYVSRKQIPFIKKTSRLLFSKNELIKWVMDAKEVPDEFLSVSEASELVKLKVSSIYFYVAKNRIPFIKKTGRLVFSKNDLMKWLSEGKKVSKEQSEGT